MSYPQIHGMPVVPVAELQNHQSAANRPGVGNSRTGSVPQVLGKYPGQNIFVDSGSGPEAKFFATGSKSSDKWQRVDGGASYAPANLGAFTVGADSTYAANLLTTDGGNDAAGRITQSVTLAAGKYVISGLAAAKGTSQNSYLAARIRIGSSAGASEYLNKVVGVSARHSTNPENLTDKEAFNLEFTVPAGSVSFTVDVINQAGAITAGAAFISIDPINSK